MLLSAYGRCVHLLDVVYVQEDVLSRQMLNELREQGLPAHAKWCTWVLQDDNPMTYHLSGRKVFISLVQQ